MDLHSKGMEMSRFAASGALKAFALLAATAVLPGCMGSTYGTGERPGVAMFREMSGGVGMGLIGLGEKKEPIEYQPRAPLVMPPSAQQLPEPSVVAAAANPQWPSERKAEPGTRFGDDNPTDDISQAEYRRLRPLGSLNRTERRGTGMPDGDMRDQAYDVINNREQRDTFQAALDDKDGVGRTERRFLTEPPQTFREPAATAPQEFDAIKKKRKGWLSGLLGG